MSSTVLLGLIGSVVIIVVLFEMLRRQTLREKYAVLWFLIAVACLAVAVFPPILFRAADLLGVEVPANLLFFGASMVLMVLTLQHSYELGRLEEKTRTLAEDLAIVRMELDAVRERLDRPDREAGPHT
ncbi:MAG: hypothetical protein JWR20_2809 [Marmoricola sp.]|nr:hypothetical protein [Marmoricola sp.]